jgi:hypothetical protein
MLSNVSIDMAIIDNDVKVIDEEGLAYRYANAIILGKYNGSFDLLRTQIDIVQEGGTVILNGDDPDVSKLVEVVSEGDNIIFYGMNNNNNVYYDSSKDSIFINNILLVDSITSKGLLKYLPIILPAVAGIWSYVDLMDPVNRQKLIDFILIYKVMDAKSNL